MVQTPKSAIVFALLCLVSAVWADGPYTRTIMVRNSSSSGSGITGTLTSGNNVYATGTNTVATDNSIADNGVGLLSLVGVSTTGVVTATTVQLGAGSIAAPSLAFTLNTTDGLYRGGNHQFNWVNNGVIYDRVAQSTRGFFVSGTTPSATVQVGANCPAACPGTFMTFGQASINSGASGGSVSVPNGGLYVSGSTYSTGSVSTSAYVNVGSPTTPPTCNALNAGNTFMNTTTHCLNYCDGTANRQVTSVAASCT